MGLTVKQGDIYLANLNPVKGHEQAGLRPVLILQSDILNERLNTTIAAPITKNMLSKGFLTTIFLPRKTAGLTEDSLALLFQIRALDKTRLLKKMGKIDSSECRNIRKRLLLLF